MNIVVDTEKRKELLETIAYREFGRLEGVHQSDLNYCLNKQGLRHVVDKAESATDREVLLYSIGYATQRWLTGQETDVDPIVKDGIIVTQDSTWNGLPFELKCTYQSDTKPPSENKHWLRQIMAQCYVTGSTTAYLSRFCLMGNWKWVYHPSKPETIAKLVQEFGSNWADRPTLQVFRLEFTQAELAIAWGWFLARKELYLNLLTRECKPLYSRGLALPDLNDPWECDYCKYNGVECKNG